jgi:hypothetical protein
LNDVRQRILALGVPTVEVWVYHTKPERPKTPFIIAPRSMAEVVDAARRRAADNVA